MVRSSRSIHSSVVNWLRHCPVLVEVERGELDRLQALDPERALLPLLLFVVLMPDVHLRPDAAHQQAVVVPQVMLGDVDELVAEVHQFGPVLVVVGEVADLHLVDEGVLALVLDHRLGFVRLVGPDEVRRQRVVDHPQPGVDGRRVVGGTVLAQQVLQDEDRDVGPDLHLADQVLADHFAREDRRRFLIELRHGSPPYIEMATSICRGSPVLPRWWRRAGTTPTVFWETLLQRHHHGDGVRFDPLAVTLRNLQLSRRRWHPRSRTRHSPATRRTSPSPAVRSALSAAPVRTGPTRLTPAICTEKNRVVSFAVPGQSASNRCPSAGQPWLRAFERHRPRRG